jgi:hypothetical protein
MTDKKRTPFTIFYEKELRCYAFLFRCHPPHTFGDDTCLVVVGP